MTDILKIKGDWEEVVNDCRTTVGKEELGHEPSSDFKRRILIAEHSPIRDISVRWKWPYMPHWVTTHWARHKFEKFIQTLRTDRTGIPRDKLPQDFPQTFVGEANSQQLIDAFRKRLCRKSSPETREYAEDFKLELHSYQPELSDTLVPHCIYRAGCSEMEPCGYWEEFVQWCVDRAVDVQALSIRKRYEMYNLYFWSVRKKHI